MHGSTFALVLATLSKLSTAAPADPPDSYGRASSEGPCDIYARGNTPCVAAHSSTRALYGSYSGGLYQLRRGSDNATTDVHPLSSGGTGNAGTQDDFCKGTTCVISKIYDQSGHGNDLAAAFRGSAGPGPNSDESDDFSGAFGAPVTLNGQKAYGIFIAPKTGYRNNKANGIPARNDPEGIYAVVDGTHFNGGCCMDYGNAESDGNDAGKALMEALYFGIGTDYTTGPERNGISWNVGTGPGPWFLADLENGLYNSDALGGNVNPTSPTETVRFVTGILKGDNNNHWSIRGGNANTNTLSTYWNGARPGGYNPMQKQGAIILGIGGDNSNGAQGTFYEGVMTTGYPSDDTENAVQANIAAANYQTTSLTSGPGLSVNSKVSFRATTSCCTSDYISHNGHDVSIQNGANVNGASASWFVRTGLGFDGCFSFESVDQPGSFLRHSNYILVLDGKDGSKQYAEDATFCPVAGLNGQGNTFRSWSYPARHWRHFNSGLSIAANGGHEKFDAPPLYSDDVSFVVEGGRG